MATTAVIPRTGLTGGWLMGPGAKASHPSPNCLVADLFELATTELLGRALFGKPSRLRVGVWIAMLPGKPHTFTQRQYWSFCTEKKWPDVGRSIKPDLQRLAQLEMVTPRPELYRGRLKYWTKMPTPLWRIFEVVAEVASIAPLDANYEPSDHAVVKARNGLLNLLKSLED